jgi:hypothetical protein
MMSGTHTITATSTMLDDPPLRLLRTKSRPTALLLADFDDEPTQPARQRVLTRESLLTMTKAGGSPVSLVITLGDATELRIDLDDSVARRSGATIPLPRS